MTLLTMNKDYNNEFCLDDKLIHVNHAAVAPWPLRTKNAVIEFAEENSRQGSLSYLHWMEKEQYLREQLRNLINAESTDEIALLKSTSEALSVVAYGIDWQAGDSIVTSIEEFPSNRILWQSLEPLGVDVRLVDFSLTDDAEQALIDASDASTRLLSISAVQYASGRKMDLQRLGQHCQSENILFCVDAIQQIGALTFDVEKINADFVAADGHKWMLGPEGLALFYCRKRHLPSLKLNQYGWHMVEKMHDFNSLEWQPALSARRFECGSPNMTGVMALSASLSLLEEAGMQTVEEKVLNNTRFLLEELSHRENLEILSNAQDDKQSGIVIFKHQQLSNDELFNYLKDQQVFCAPRGGGIRLSPHFYTPESKLQALLKIIDKAS